MAGVVCAQVMNLPPYFCGMEVSLGGHAVGTWCAGELAPQESSRMEAILVQGLGHCLQWGKYGTEC